MFKLLRTTATGITIGLTTSACLFTVTDDQGTNIPVQAGGYLDLRQSSTDGEVVASLRGFLPRTSDEIEGVDQINIHCIDLANPSYDFPNYANGNAFLGSGPGWRFDIGATSTRSELANIFTACPVESYVDEDSGEVSHRANIALSYQSAVRFIYLPTLTQDNTLCIAQSLASDIDWTVALGDCLVADGRDLGGDWLGMPPAAVPYPGESEYFPPAEVNKLTIEISDELYLSFQE